MANARGYLADYLAGLAGDELAEVRGALALQSRPVPKLIIAGDSRGNNHKGALLWSVRGPMCWARYKLGCRFDIDHQWVTAIPGTQIKEDNGSGISELNQLVAFFAASPSFAGSFVALWADVNDVTNGRTGAQMIADKSAVVSLVLSLFCTPIVFTCIVPTIWNATQRLHAERYNHWVRSLAADGRIVVADIAPIIVDWASDTSQPIGSGANGYLFDTTHFGPIGAEIAGTIIAAAMESRLPPAVWRGQGSPTDLYDAANNPFGNLSSKGRFSASGGLNTDIAGNAGSASTGSVAANCRLYKQNGDDISVVGAVTSGTVDFAGEAVTVPVQNIKVTAGSTAGKRTAFFKLPDITTNFAAGDVVRNEAYVKVKKSVGLYGAGIQLWDMTAGGAVSQNYGDLAGWSSAGVWSYLLNRVRAGFQRSSRLTLTGTTALLRPFLVIEGDGQTADVEVEISNDAVRRVA